MVTANPYIGAEKGEGRGRLGLRADPLHLHT